jgi:hypothetical protein
VHRPGKVSRCLRETPTPFSDISRGGYAFVEWFWKFYLSAAVPSAIPGYCKTLQLAAVVFIVAQKEEIFQKGSSRGLAKLFFGFFFFVRPSSLQFSKLFDHRALLKPTFDRAFVLFCISYFFSVRHFLVFAESVLDPPRVGFQLRLISLACR